MSDYSIEDYFKEQGERPEFRVESILSDLAVELADKIREMREAKGLTQADFASLLKTQQSQVSRYENPVYAKYTLQSLAKIADALDCRLKINLEQVTAPAARLSYFDIIFKPEVKPTADGELVGKSHPAAANNVIKFPVRIPESGVC